MNDEDIKAVVQKLSSFSDALPSRFELSRIFDTDSFDKETELVRCWQRSGLDDRRDLHGELSIKISVCGFSTLSYLKPHLIWAALADGVIPEIIIGGYNQLYQELASDDSIVTHKDVDILWIWAQLEDLLPREITDNPNILLSSQGLKAVEQSIESLLKALVALRERFKGLIVINDFFPDRLSAYGIADSNRAVQHEQVYRRAMDVLQQGLSQLTYSTIFPLSGLVRHYGLDNAIDRRLQILADCRFTPEFFFKLARAFRPYIRSVKAIVKKVLVLDLDNTLWGGVVGKDGWDKVKIGNDGVGKAFLLFQAAILELHNRGVVLAINSKNNPEDVNELFQKRQEMLLKPEHFAAIKTNWHDKITNCIEIAKEINVGLDSLVFWDDNPSERLLIRHGLEQVFVVELPGDVALWADFVRTLGLFDSLQLSEEDAKRGQMYAQERLRRQTASLAPDLDSFLKLLELEVEIQDASEQNIPRIVSLVSRTNQFNLTTRRHSEQTIRDWERSDDCKITCYAAQDRFGSYGIIGVTILKKTDGDVEIDSLLLSCRAIGKGIEKVMLSVVMEQARQMGAGRVKATYIPTKKNSPVKDFLPNNGFCLINEDDTKKYYDIDLSQVRLTIPEYIGTKVT